MVLCVYRFSSVLLTRNSKIYNDLNKKEIGQLRRQWSFRHYRNAPMMRQNSTLESSSSKAARQIEMNVDTHVTNSLKRRRTELSMECLPTNYSTRS